MNPQQRKLYYRLFILLLACAWGYITFASFGPRGIDYSVYIHDSGWLAWYALVFTIFISLIQKLVRWWFPKVKIFTWCLPLRKYTGVFAFLLATVHGATVLIQREGSVLYESMFTDLLDTAHAEFLGFFAWLLMLPLFFTSTNWAVRKMGGRAWKNLQRMAHVVFILAGLHIGLMDYFRYQELLWPSLILLFCYALGYSLLFLRRYLRKRTAKVS